MTATHHFDTWREAYDFALTELSTPMYRDWGWARVNKVGDKWLSEIA